MAVIIIPQTPENPSIPARFREAGATEPGRAIVWAPLGRTEEASFARLVRKGALVEMRPGTWYLNEEKLSASGTDALAVAVLVSVVALLGVGLALLLAN